MYKDKKIVAVIPARGGSKGIPGKNIKALAGKPLIGYVIDAVMRSKYVDDVYVSTEDEKIAAVSKKYGAKIVQRPAELATDTASSESALLHFADQVHFDCLLFLQCTAPLTSTEDINGIIESYFKSDCDMMFSVCEGDGGFHASRFVWDGNSEPVGHDFPRKRRQDLPALYKENGAMYLMTRANLLTYQDRFHGKKQIYVMPKSRSYDIDNIEDFDFLEKLLRFGLVGESRAQKRNIPSTS